MFGKSQCRINLVKIVGTLADIYPAYFSLEWQNEIDQHFTLEMIFLILNPTLSLFEYSNIKYNKNMEADKDKYQLFL